MQNDCTILDEISCFSQISRLYIASSISKLRPLVRFLCLINSFYAGVVSCMYNIYIYIYRERERSNISNVSLIYLRCILIRSYILSLCLAYSLRISSSHRRTSFGTQNLDATWTSGCNCAGFRPPRDPTVQNANYRLIKVLATMFFFCHICPNQLTFEI